VHADPGPLGSKALDPGSWGVVAVARRGRGRCRSAGLYQMKQLVFEPDATLAFDVSGGAIEIRCGADAALLRDRTVFSVTAGPARRRIQFYSTRVTTVRIGTDIPRSPACCRCRRGHPRQLAHGGERRAAGQDRHDGARHQGYPDRAVLGSGTSWLGRGRAGWEIARLPTALDTRWTTSRGSSGTPDAAFDGLA